MATIKDSVHDHIAVEGVAEDLLDTPAVQRLEEASAMVGAFRRARRARWRLGVYCPSSDVEPVAAAAEDVLGLP